MGDPATDVMQGPDDRTALPAPVPPGPVPPQRQAEYDALVALLMANATPPDEEGRGWAQHIATAALEPVHLFRAMGFDTREELSTLMRERFNPLFLGNTKNMRWKRYLYKRLCGWEGFHH